MSLQTLEFFPNFWVSSISENDTDPFIRFLILDELTVQPKNWLFVEKSFKEFNGANHKSES